MRCIKFCSFFVLWSNVALFALFVLGGQVHSGKYVDVDVDVDVWRGAREEVLLRINNMDFSRQKIYLRIKDVPSRYLSTISNGGVDSTSSLRFEVDGRASSKMVCQGGVMLQEERDLKGIYSISNALVMVELASIKHSRECSFEVKISSNYFSELLPRVAVVRGGEGELFGFDLRSYPVFLAIINVGYYASLWYLSAFGGLPFFIGSGLALIALGVFLIPARG